MGCARKRGVPRGLTPQTDVTCVVFFRKDCINHTPGCTANVNVLICAMPASVKKEVGKVDYEMLVDTQAAPGHDFHFIKDAELMLSLIHI